MSDALTLLELQSVRSRANRDRFSAYIERLMLSLYNGGHLDGRQLAKLRSEKLLDKEDKLTLYGKMVLSRMVQQDKQRQDALKPLKSEDKEKPLWQQAEDRAGQET